MAAEVLSFFLDTADVALVENLTVSKNTQNFHQICQFACIERFELIIFTNQSQKETEFQYFDEMTKSVVRASDRYRSRQ